MHPFKKAAHSSGRAKMSALGGKHTKANAEERAHGGKTPVRFHHRTKHLGQPKVHGMKGGGRLDRPSRGAKHIHHTKININAGPEPLPMGATPGMTPTPVPPPGMGAGPMPAGVPGMGGLQKKGGRIKYAKGGKVRHYDDGGDVPTPYVGQGGGKSEVEEDQYAGRTGQDTENVGLAYPKQQAAEATEDESQRRSISSAPKASAPKTTRAVSARAKPPMPRSRPKAADQEESAPKDLYGGGSKGYNEMLAIHRRGGKVKRATGGRVKNEEPKLIVKSNGQSKTKKLHGGGQNKDDLLRKADGGRIRANYANQPKEGALTGLHRIHLSKNAAKINRHA